MPRSIISTAAEVRPGRLAAVVLALLAAAYLAGVMTVAQATPAPAAATSCSAPR